MVHCNGSQEPRCRSGFRINVNISQNVPLVCGLKTTGYRFRIGDALEYDRHLHQDGCCFTLMVYPMVFRISGLISHLARIWNSRLFYLWEYTGKQGMRGEKSPYFSSPWMIVTYTETYYEVHFRSIHHPTIFDSFGFFGVDPRSHTHTASVSTLMADIESDE